MPEELIVILIAEIILLAAVVGMTFWRRRTDVLSGRYFSGRTQPVPFLAIERPLLSSAGKRGVCLQMRPIAESSAQPDMRIIAQT